MIRAIHFEKYWHKHVVTKTSPWGVGFNPVAVHMRLLMDKMPPSYVAVQVIISTHVIRGWYKRPIYCRIKQGSQSHPTSTMRNKFKNK
jgi:hypothetical protein